MPAGDVQRLGEGQSLTISYSGIHAYKTQSQIGCT